MAEKMAEKQAEGGAQGKPDIEAEVDLLMQKDKLPDDDTPAHSGSKPGAAGDGGSMHQTGQGQGQSAGKPQTQPQE
jgi:hypothetical protein